MKKRVANPRPVTEPNAGRGYFTLTKNYVAPLKSVGAYVKILAPFPFDGASIPRPVWSILGLYPMHPKVQAAALVHDALYCAQITTRAVADAIFADLCRNDGVDRFRVGIMYSALRVAGCFSWHNKTPGTIKAARRCVFLGSHPMEEVVPLDKSKAETRKVIVADLGGV